MKAGKVAIFTLVLGLFAWGSVWGAGRKVVLDLQQHPVNVKAQKVVKVQTPTADRTEAAVLLQHDDGTIENGLWFGAGVQFISANRFPDPGVGPFNLEQVSILQSDGNTPGEPVELVIARDANPGACPAVMEVLYTEMVTVQNNDGVTWDVYNLAQGVPFLGGDLYIGFINRSSNGYSFLDETASQGMSWMGRWAANPAPATVTMPPDSSWFLVDDVGFPGNWFIRGAGTTLDASLSLGAVTFGDGCVYGHGNDNGVLDPGEAFTLWVPITNNGPMAADGLVADLTSTYGGITWTSGPVGFGTLNPGATYTATFTGTLSLATPCGTNLPFNLNVTGTTFPSVWDLTFSEIVGAQTPPAVTDVLVEAFETWPPAGWTITDVTSGGPWAAGLSLVCYSGGRTNDTGACGDFAAADADCPGAATNMSTQMDSPIFSLLGFPTATLEFFTDINDYYGTTVGSVQITTDGGGAWTDIQVWTGPGGGWNNLANGQQTFSLTPYAGNPACQLRFWYVAPMWEAWWQVDDVHVFAGTPAGPCTSTGCIPPFQLWFTIPVNGGNVYGMTTLCVDVSDPTLVVSVDFFVDGVLMGSDATYPYCVTFDASALTLGAHTYTAVANMVGGGTTWATAVTFYTVPDVVAFPDADPPAGMAPLVANFYSNAMYGTGVYAYEWYFGEVSGGSGPDSTEQNPSNVYGDAGDYLVTLFVSDTSGMMFICDPMKITVTELAAGVSHPVGVPVQSLVGSM